MKIFDIIRLNKRINTLENEAETLRNIIKNELFEELMSRVIDHDKLKQLEKENTRLRIKIKKLKNK